MFQIQAVDKSSRTAIMFHREGKHFHMKRERTFTPSEAAVVSGVPVQAVNKAIDGGPLHSARDRKSGERTLTETDLLYLATTGIFDPKLVKLTEQARSRLRKALASYYRIGKQPGKLVLFEGLEIDVRPVVAKLRSKATLLDRARKMVAVNPHIRGGEAVIRGTRIGVYEVAAMAEGASEEEVDEILAGYPTLKREHLELARMYAAAHPRRGRPPKHPWHRTRAAASA
jgi:uncharacterized protein (DUF433 family)